MTYDLVVRNGTVIDGSGLPRFRADVGVVGGKIAKIGRVTEKGSSEIDAEGHIVSPGFIDGHTHMDAQIAWDPLGTSSCWHGITTVVMGNCGFSVAPVNKGQEAFVVRNLERAEPRLSTIRTRPVKAGVSRHGTRSTSEVRDVR